MRPALLALATTLIVACAAGPRPEVTDPPSAVPQTPGAPTLLALGDGLWPADSAHMRTTSGSLYLHNLDARIDMLDARQATDDGLRDRQALAAALWHRFRLLGRLPDAERALAMTDRLAGDPEAPARSLFLRAVVLGGFHRFEEAEAALAEAERLGYPTAEVSRQRADFHVALGRYDLLAEDLARSAEPIGDFDQLAHRADLRLLLGDLQGAERQYWAAQGLYRDINPVPLAWLHVQMGIALLRFEQIERAAAFFAAAVERLPGYSLAEEHLAECEFRLGRLDDARTRYLRVIEGTRNPEYMAALAEVERARGDLDAAALWTQRARSGFEVWIDRYGTTFAHHAAEFFIEQGDIAAARRLADANLALRQDAGSWLLEAEVALAERRPGRACEALEAITSAGLRPPETGPLLRQAGCPPEGLRGAMRGSQGR